MQHYWCSFKLLKHFENHQIRMKKNGCCFSLRYIRLFPQSVKMVLQIGNVKKFPLNYNISLNMKKKKNKLFDINKLIQSDK